DLVGKNVLLIIGGGIAAYKCLELIRRLRDRGAQVGAILTEAGGHFVTPLSVSSLTGEKIYQELFDLTAESEMGHIALSRAADLVVVAPATADLRLAGLKAILPAGPTYEPIDPVRYIANRSSGKQGYAIASALAGAGAQTVLVSGPVELNPPNRVKLVKVETAREMWAACEAE